MFDGVEGPIFDILVIDEYTLNLYDNLLYAGKCFVLIWPSERARYCGPW